MENSATTPDVTLTISHTKATKGQPVSLTASSPAAIAKVEFYVGFKLKATAKSTPFSATWTPKKPGSTVIVAKAYLANGQTALSAPAKVEVTK